MKIKFEVKTNPKLQPVYTIFMEHKELDQVELLMTKYTAHQQSLGTSTMKIENKDEPIVDGKLIMSITNLKKFIAALQLLVKS